MQPGEFAPRLLFICLKTGGMEIISIPPDSLKKSKKFLAISF